MPDKLVYHYTVGNKLSLILASGELRPTGVMVAPSEKPVLWFSADPVYEPTAIKLIMRGGGQAYRPSLDELCKLAGIFRFCLSAKDERLITFNRLQRIAHISPKGMSDMIASGLRIGAKPTNWFGTMSEVALNEVIFEEWNGSTWIPGSITVAIERVKNSGMILKSKSAYELGLTNAY